MMKTTNDKLTAAARRTPPRAFTLIELLVVISIMALLAAFTLPVVHSLKRQEYVKVAQAERDRLVSALDSYQKQYGTYPPSNPNVSPLYNTLYYELTGVTNSGGSANANFITLDNAASIRGSDYKTVFTIDGVVNCTQGGAEEGRVARNFLIGLRPNQLASVTVTTGGPPITNLVTSVRGPDLNYKPVGIQDVNPFRYQYPGTNNPNSYDLWVQLVIYGKTNLICNWSKNPIYNSPLP